MMEVSMTPQDRVSSDQNQTGAWPQGDALDSALSAVLRAPPLPAGFHAALRGAIAREAEQDLLALRSALETERAQHLAELRAGYVRLQRNTLSIALAVAFTAGAAATVVLPWLASAIGTDVSTLAPLLVAVIGLGVGAAVFLERFGLLRWR
jgi:hypothetical protein